MKFRLLSQDFPDRRSTLAEWRSAPDVHLVLTLEAQKHLEVVLSVLSLLHRHRNVSHLPICCASMRSRASLFLVATNRTTIYHRGSSFANTAPETAGRTEEMAIHRGRFVRVGSTSEPKDRGHSGSDFNLDTARDGGPG